ncbi:MAG: iron-sulfur cluster assembly protein, partial [Acetobacter syzygii]
MAQTAPFSPDTLMDLLSTVKAPQTGLSLASAGRLESCTVDDGGRLTLTLTVPREQASALSALCDDAAKKLQTLPNVTSATIILTAHRPAGVPAPQPGGHAGSL